MTHWKTTTKYNTKQKKAIEYLLSTEWHKALIIPRLGNIKKNSEQRVKKIKMIREFKEAKAYILTNLKINTNEECTLYRQGISIQCK